MRKTLMTLSLLALTLSGCTKLSIERTDKDGTVVRFKSANLFQNSSMSKLSVDKKTTGGSYSGLSIGSVDNDTATEAIKAAGEAFGNAAAAAARKAIVP